MTESGDVAKGTTQIGDVKRPLAAVSNITKANNIAFFCDGDDWIIDRKDELAETILKLVRRVRKKTKMYQYKGTYRMRAWLMPEEQKGPSHNRPFGRQGR